MPGWELHRDIKAVVGAPSRVAWGCLVWEARGPRTADGWNAGDPLCSPQDEGGEHASSLRCGWDVSVLLSIIIYNNASLQPQLQDGVPSLPGGSLEGSPLMLLLRKQTWVAGQHQPTLGAGEGHRKKQQEKRGKWTV